MGDFPPFTSIERFDNVQPGDNTFAVTGVISALDPRPARANAPTSRVYLFRCILNNMNGRQVRILFWEDMAKTWETQVYGQVVTITRTRIVPVDSRYSAPANLMKIELSVQRNSVVTLHGPYGNLTNVAVPMAPEVPLSDIGRAEGIVRIVGYVETAIEQQTYGNASYGCGAITDGFYRLVVNITTFNLNLCPPLGSHVRVQGTLRRNNMATLLLQIPDMASMQIVDEEVMGAAQLAEGFRIPPGVVNGHSNQEASTQVPAVGPAVPNRAQVQVSLGVVGNIIPGPWPPLPEVAPVRQVPVAVELALPNADAVARVQKVLGLNIANDVPRIPAAVGPVIPNPGAVGEIPAAAENGIAQQVAAEGRAERADNCEDAVRDVQQNENSDAEISDLRGSPCADRVLRRPSEESDPEFPVFDCSGYREIENGLEDGNEAGPSSNNAGESASSSHVSKKRRREAALLEKPINQLKSSGAIPKRRSNANDIIVIHNSDDSSDE